MIRQAIFQFDFIPGMTFDSTHNHLSRDAIEIGGELVQNDFAVPPVAVAVIVWKGLPLAGFFILRLIVSCPDHLAQEGPKELETHVANWGKLCGFLGPNHFRDGRGVLFHAVRGNTRIIDELSGVGNRPPGDGLSN